MNVHPLPNRGVTSPHERPNVGRLQIKLELYQRLVREWAPHLDPFEFAIAAQVLDRTIGWGETSVQISASKLQRGSAAMGRTKFFEAVASLEAKGLVLRSGDAGNREKMFYSINPGWNPDLANVAKQVRDQSATRTPLVRHTDQLVRHADTIYNYSSTNTSLTDTQPDLPVSQSDQNPREEIREAAITEQSAQRAYVRDRAASTRGFGNSVGVEAAWRAALHDSFPAVGHAPWDHRQRANVKRAVQAWLNANQISFEDFAGWAVTNWTAIISKQFKWMQQKSPPTTPQIGFFLYFLPQFAECWAEGTLDDWMSSSDRTELERLIGRGMTYEQALREVGARQATTALRKQTDERSREATAKLERAKRTVEQARKIAESKGVAVHPQSVKAKEMRGERPLDIRPTMEIGDYDFGGAQLLDPTRNPFN